MTAIAQETEGRAPESMTERIACAVTPTERRKVEFIAGLEGSSVSELVRSIVMPEVERRRAELLGKLEKIA
jgi:hypothetical protein